MELVSPFLISCMVQIGSEIFYHNFILPIESIESVKRHEDRRLPFLDFLFNSKVEGSEVVKIKGINDKKVRQKPIRIDMAHSFQIRLLTLPVRGGLGSPPKGFLNIALLRVNQN